MASPEDFGPLRRTSSSGHGSQHSESQGSEQSAQGRTEGLSGRAMAKGVSNVIKARCSWCISKRKSCDSAKPVCGNCQRTPGRCEWPVGNPSRRGLHESIASRRLDRGDPQDGGHVTPKKDSTTSDTAGALLGPDDGLFHACFASPDRLFTQVGRPAAGASPTQQLPVQNQAPDNNSNERLRLDQVRTKVLESTRSYLGCNTQPLVLEKNVD
ncbi:uncharacterized protein A1O9_10022 [Exophiala aquamarina CBS 119918]|uniref:Zn(2)-C6 fungal-type domain-containing protein n=1 Tax=Exophiala aquamarina CBS 119918 TaxID=1182545 RepID=A0A072P2Y2_9EURO|nr:uncharacterized protein A1O9_10022 [Exophiala aquamarina CBS 119918]KEF53623.1 hypothetical protein A1O9_10022 [Exophiala aquamarina CBS 119918]